MSEIADKFGGIYVHIPFCVKKCPYCDFYSITDLSGVSPFLKALRREIETVSVTDQVFDTLYIGGGTPSVLEAESIRQIIDAANTHFTVCDDIEITLEVNPGTISRESLRDFRRAGVNRLNIGIQSFQSNNLRFLGRIHSAAEAALTIEWARQAGFDNIGLDLIYGLTAQDKENWLGDLTRAIETETEHLSCYMLTIESDTPLGRDVAAARIQLPSDGTVRELFDTTIDFLTTHGFVQYEISNFARQTGAGSEPRFSRHNQKYWSFSPYLGLGPSAHSFEKPFRWWNHRSVRHYLSDIEAGKKPISKKETLTLQDSMIEAIYLGLRKTEGIDIDRFDLEFGASFQKTFGPVLGHLRDAGQLFIEKGRCALTRKGMLFLDSIASMLVSQEF